MNVKNECQLVGSESMIKLSKIILWVLCVLIKVNLQKIVFFYTEQQKSEPKT